MDFIAFKVDIFSMKNYMVVMDVVNDVTYSHKIVNTRVVIIRDYRMGILVIARSINPRLHYRATTSYAGIITSIHLKCMISGYQPAVLITCRRETLSHMQTWGYR